MMQLFGSSAEADIILFGLGNRKMFKCKTRLFPIFRVPSTQSQQDLKGEIQITPKGKKFQHSGINLELIGLLQSQNKQASQQILRITRNISNPSQLSEPLRIPFNFSQIEKLYQSYYGQSLVLFYQIKLTVIRNYAANITREMEIFISKPQRAPGVNAQIKTELGFQDAVHIEFQLNKYKFHLQDCIQGTLYFHLIRVQVESAFLRLLKKQTTLGSTQTVQIENFQIMDGAAAKSDSIPIRVFLQNFQLSPSIKFPNIVVKYFLQIYIIDTSSRSFSKEIEIFLWRSNQQMPKNLRAKSTKKKKHATTARKPIKKNKSNSSTNPDRVIKGKKPHMMRDKATIKRLNMYNQKPNEEQRKKRPDLPAMIEPDRRWFGNTRTIKQDQLQTFRKQVKQATHDPYSIILNQTKLPFSLINQPSSSAKPELLSIEPFSDTFGAKARRKRPKLQVSSLSGLLEHTEQTQGQYQEEKDSNIRLQEDMRDLVRDKRLEAGQSKRIWEQLYKVLDSSDVVCQVLDARNPKGTRCPHIQRQIKKQPHKHLIFVLNKCDLVPTWVSVGWVKQLSKEYPTIAFHASVTNPFGKLALISLLKQFDKHHREKKTISVGFIGYPNVGKSSVINTLRKKDVCKVAPIPGQTKVWQYISMTKRIYLIDCPGVVYDIGDSDEELVLKGVVRPEKLDDASLYVQGIIERTKREDLYGLYGVDGWDDSEEFLEKLAQKSGRLLKNAEADFNTVAKMILHDWQRGKIPYFFPPPN